MALGDMIAGAVSGAAGQAVDIADKTVEIRQRNAELAAKAAEEYKRLSLMHENAMSQIKERAKLNESSAAKDRVSREKIASENRKTTGTQVVTDEGSRMWQVPREGPATPVMGQREVVHQDAVAGHKPNEPQSLMERRKTESVHLKGSTHGLPKDWKTKYADAVTRMAKMISEAQESMPPSQRMPIQEIQKQAEREVYRLFFGPTESPAGREQQPAANNPADPLGFFNAVPDPRQATGSDRRY